MTAVDHAELKRVAEGASAFNYDGWTYQTPSDPLCAGRVMASEHGPVIATVQWPVPMMDHALSGVDSSRPVGAFIAAANPAVVLALLSEIEGLKAERDGLRAGINTLELERKRPGVRLVHLQRAVAVVAGAALRNQAPDSWRPDRDAVMAIIDANKYEPWTVDRAGQMADAILAVRPHQDESMTAAFVPIDGQCFTSEQDWINRATRVLTGHAQYNNTEHGDASGWRGPHFTALSFDQAGRRVRNGADFKRATVEGTYPVWWIWPDQIAPALRPQTAESGK